MARTNNLSNFLTDVAGAIREKTGGSSTIPASEFDTEIRSITTAGNYQIKNLNISQNGSTIVTPDTGYDAIEELNLSVTVNPNLQNKTITQNGSYSADQGYDGLGTVLVNVPSQQINNQNKTITQNGSYTADSGYTGLGTVLVNVPSGSGDVKLFATEQAMQADPNPSEGDLAVVYREELTGITEDSEFDSCIFPNTVVLDEAFTGSIYGSFRSTGSGWFDGNVDMSSSSFRFNGWGDEMIRVEYTSNDGITYTRTDGGEELQEFGTTIKWESWGDPFNDVIGNFMKIGGKAFEGFYEYKTAADENISCLGVRFSDLYPIYTEGNTLYQYKSNLTNASLNLSRLNNDDISEYGTDGLIVFKIQTESGLYYGETLYKPIEGYAPFIGTGVQIGWLIDNDTNTEYLIACITGSAVDKTFLHYTGSGYENITVLVNEWQSIATYNTQSRTNVTYNYKILDTIDPTQWVATYGLSLFLQGSTGTDGPVIITKATAGNTSTRTGCAVLPLYGTITRYFSAPTQLTLTSSGDIWEDVIAYGKNGVVTGDGSIKDKLDIRDLIKNTSGIDLIKSGELISTKYHNIQKGSTISLINKQSFNYASGVAIIENLDNKIPSATRELLESSHTNIDVYDDNYIIVTHWTAQKSMNIILLDKDWIILDTKTITYGTVPNVANWTYYTKPTFKLVYNSTLNTTFVVFNRYDNITNSDLSSSRRGAEKITVYKIVNNALSELSTQTVSSNVNYYDKISYNAVPLSSGVGVFIHSYMKSSSNFMCYNFDTSGTVSTKTLSITYVNFNASMGYTGISSWTENTDYAYVLCGDVTWARGAACVKITKSNGNLTTLDISSYLGQANIQPYLVRGTNTRSYLNSDAGLYKIVDSTITKIADKRNDTLSMTRYDEDSDTGFYQYSGADISGVQIYDRLWYSISERYSDISYSGNSASYTNNYNDGIYNANLYYFTIGENTRMYVHTYVDFTKEISTTKGNYEYIKINGDDVFAKIEIDTNTNFNTNIPEDI